MCDMIVCVDSDDYLELWNYTESDNDSDEIIKENRGLIKDKEGNVVCKSFGYTDEYTTENIPDNFEWSDWKWFYSYESTLLRLFYFKDRWYLSTHKKLDAFKSRWSCKQTFGDLFIDYMNEIFNHPQVLEYLASHLNVNHRYFFILKSNPQNRIVCHSHFHQQKMRVLLLGWFQENDEFIFHSPANTESIILQQIQAPERIEYDEGLKDKINALNVFQYQGIIGFHKTNFSTIKILNPEYKQLYDIRGNNPNLRFRYLEVRNDPDKVKLLYYLYPKYSELFDEYENTLFKIARLIYKYYVQRYIRKLYITLPKEEYGLMKKCHEWYMKDRAHHRIFTQTVLDFMNEESALALYKMIRRYHHNPEYYLEQHKPLYQEQQSLNYTPVPKHFAYYNTVKVGNLRFPPLE